MLYSVVRFQKAPPVPRFFKEGLTLDHFLLRAQVISLYRQIVNVPKAWTSRMLKRLFTGQEPTLNDIVMRPILIISSH
ncbi:unnamed protein product [Rhizopus microsporus]